jgi:hypothetical protein
LHIIRVIKGLEIFSPLSSFVYNNLNTLESASEGMEIATQSFDILSRFRIFVPASKQGSTLAAKAVGLSSLQYSASADRRRHAVGT